MPYAMLSNAIGRLRNLRESLSAMPETPNLSTEKALTQCDATLALASLARQLWSLEPSRLDPSTLDELRAVARWARSSGAALPGDKPESPDVRFW